jgi:hypothetical protein
MHKKRLALFLFMCCVPALAQQSVVLPPPLVDGTTCAVAPSTGVLSCPGSMTYSAATGVLSFNGVAITNLSLQTLSLTGGTSYPDGKYIISMATGVATLVLYVPQPTPGTTYNVTLTKIGGTSWTVVPGLTLTAGQQATAMAVPTHSGQPLPADWYYYSNSQPRVQVDTTGAVYVGISNSTSTAIATASVTVTVK